MKKSLLILIDSISNVRDFVKIAESFDFDIDAKQGKYIVDSKSVMGLFSLNVLEPITIELVSDDEDEINRFFEMCNKFIKET